MERELQRLEREERRRQASARLSFQRIAKQQRFMSRTGSIAIGAIVFCFISLLLIGYESATSFSELFSAPPGEEGAGRIVLIAIAIVVFFLLVLVAFGLYIIVWSRNKKKWLEQEQEILRKELDGLAKQKEALRQQLEQG